MSYLPPALVEFVEFDPVERLARLWHEAYERKAAELYGYPPSHWSGLTEADRRHIYLPSRPRQTPQSPCALAARRYTLSCLWQADLRRGYAGSGHGREEAAGVRR